MCGDRLPSPAVPPRRAGRRGTARFRFPFSQKRNLAPRRGVFLLPPAPPVTAESPRCRAASRSRPPQNPPTARGWEQVWAPLGLSGSRTWDPSWCVRSQWLWLLSLNSCSRGKTELVYLHCTFVRHSRAPVSLNSFTWKSNPSEEAWWLQIHEKKVIAGSLILGLNNAPQAKLLHQVEHMVGLNSRNSWQPEVRHWWLPTRGDTRRDQDKAASYHIPQFLGGTTGTAGEGAPPW